MKKIELTSLCALALAAWVSPALATPIKPNMPVSEGDIASGKVTLDPAGGYILVGGDGPANGTFLRVPDAETRAEWEKDRQEALAKALKKYPGKVLDWQKYVSQLKQMRPKETPPPKPAEPTLDTVEVEPLELRDSVTFGPQGRLTKGGRIAFLTTAKPGLYYWSGRTALAPSQGINVWSLMSGPMPKPVAGDRSAIGGGLNGICVCMGTVQFEVKPGTVTNLGNMLWALPELKSDPTVAQMGAAVDAQKRSDAGKDAKLDQFAAPALDMTVPDSLKGGPVLNAQLQAHGKFSNYFGGEVSRLAPIPGVLSYRRDTVIDERTGQALPNPKLVSMQKPKL